MKRQKTQLQQLINWANNNGAIVNFEFHERSCIMKSADINNAKKLVAFIPNKLLLSTSTAMESQVGKLLMEKFETGEYEFLGEKYPHALELIILTLFIVFEKRLENSYWKPYLDSLPNNFDLPLVWKNEEVKNLLSGTSLENITVEKLKWIRKVTDCVNGFNIDLIGTVEIDEFQWAYSAISSRAFPRAKMIENKVVHNNEWLSISEICLYPVLDMLDHHPDAKIEWIMDPTGVKFVTNDNVQPGIEVYNNYGPKGNENLLSNYGFVLVNNLNDYCKIRLNVQKKDPFAKIKRKMVDSLGIGYDFLLFGDDLEVNEKFMNTACILVAKEYELVRFKTDKLLKHYKRTQYLAAQTLLKLVNKKLNQIKNGELLMNEMEESNRKSMACIYRQGQKHILEHYQQLIGKLMAALVPHEDNIFSMNHPNIDQSFLIDLKALLGDGWDELDEDVQLIFVLLNEKANPDSFWQSHIKSLPARNSEQDYSEIMG